MQNGERRKAKTREKGGRQDRKLGEVFLGASNPSKALRLDPTKTPSDSLLMQARRGSEHTHVLRLATVYLYKLTN